MGNTAVEGISNGNLALLGIVAFLLWTALTSQEEGESVGSALGKIIGLGVKAFGLLLVVLAAGAMFCGFAGV